MGRKGKGPRQPPVKGFRPGKEPAHLRRKRAKAELGKDAGWAQKAMVDAVADRSPDEVARSMDRWVRIMLLAGIILFVTGLPLYRWSVVAGVALHVLAALAVFLWFRLRAQKVRMVELAESISGGGAGGGAGQKRR